MRAEFLCISVLRVASGPGVGLAGCGGCFKPPGGLTQGEVGWLWGCFGPPGGLLYRPF